MTQPNEQARVEEQYQIEEIRKWVIEGDYIPPYEKSKINFLLSILDTRQKRIEEMTILLRGILTYRDLDKEIRVLIRKALNEEGK